MADRDEGKPLDLTQKMEERSRRVASEGDAAHSPSMEERLAKLEEQNRQHERAIDGLSNRVQTLAQRMHSDFRWTWAVTLGGFLALLGTLAKGFGWL